MSYLPSYILLVDSIRTHNCRGIAHYKSELQRLSPDAQLDLFTSVLSTGDSQTIQELVLIIDTYCPAIMCELLHFAIDTRNKTLFALLYQDYGVKAFLNLFINCDYFTKINSKNEAPPDRFRN